MVASQTIPPLEPWFIGLAFQFKNAQLNIDSFGSPFEIVQQLKQANIEPMHAAKHIATEITVRKVHKDGRVGHFSGGPNALGLMELLDTMAAKDWDAARRVLGQYPTLLTSGDRTATVPLSINAALGQSGAVEFLIANGAPVNGGGDLGMTPLHWAAVHDQPAIVAILLKAGAIQSLRSWFFLTPANLAHANSHAEVLLLLAPENPNAAKVYTMDILRAMGCASKK